MFSDLYEPLPDLEKALERIGCADLEIRDDIETLDKLIYGFSVNVPFENLAVSVEHRIPSLESADLYEKIVMNRRGGYCFEMNGFFWLLLRDLGFQTYPVSAYVLEYQPSLGDLGHRASIVITEGRKYIVDVGFGGKNTAQEAIPMDGSIKDGFFVKYDVKEREHTLCRIVDEEKEKADGKGQFVLHTVADGREVSYIRLILFRDYKAYPQEFYLPNIALSHVENNHMVDNVVVNLKNGRGETYTIFNDEFRGKTANGSFIRKIESSEEFKKILESYFGMDVSKLDVSGWNDRLQAVRGGEGND